MIIHKSVRLLFLQQNHVQFIYFQHLTLIAKDVCYLLFPWQYH